MYSGWAGSGDVCTMIVKEKGLMQIFTGQKKS